MEQLMGDINFASKVHFGFKSNTRVAEGTAISLSGGQSF